MLFGVNRVKKNIFKQIILKFILSFVLILLINLLIFTICVLNIKNNHSVSERIDTIMNHVSVTNSAITLDEKGQSLLKQKKLWLLAIDNKTGKVQYSYQKPQAIPNQYSYTEVAKFSRYYLNDYPVFTYAKGNYLFVIGFPKNSYARYSNNYLPISMIKKIPFIFLLTILLNCAYFILLYIYSNYRLRKKILPLVKMIMQLPNGLSSSIKPIYGLEEIIQALEQTDNKLKEEQKFRQDWIAGIAHDIKTPLSIVLSNVAIAKDYAHNPELNKYLDPILTETYYIQNVLNDLNIFARLNNQACSLQKENIYILSFIKEVIIQILNQEIWENIDIAFQADEDLKNVSLQLDPFLFSRVIHNLIYNAILHNPDGCQITISLTKINEKICLTVLDDGIGVTNEQLKQLNTLDDRPFDIAFIRTTGIGLYISKKIIQLNNGRMVISSKYKEFFKVEIFL